MKSALTVTFLISCFGITALTALATKPTDTECINYLRNVQTDPVERIFSIIEYNKYSLKVEDHLFYKQIYSAIDGHRVATALFGTIIKS